MKLKNDNVSLSDLVPQMVVGLMMANEVYNEYDVDMVWTSSNDSNHALTSLHYSGNAVDLRTRTLRAEDKQRVRHKIKEKLNIDFDVVLEPDHIHLEYQPRRR